MLSWSRPDPLTRDLVHLINARRHDHGDTEAAIDTLQAFLEQGREYRSRERCKEAWWDSCSMGEGVRCSCRPITMLESQR